MSGNNKRVEWTKGSAFRADPSLALSEIEQLDYRFGGQAPTGALVEHARNPTSVLHKDFEWDDSVAAQKHRIDTEKKIKRSLVYVCDKGLSEDTEIKTVRVFSSVKVADAPGASRIYLNTMTALEDPLYRQQILENAKRELQQFVNKYDALVELADVISPIKKQLNI